MDKLEALASENKTLKQVIEKVNAQKTAIDQVCLNSIQENINLRTEIVLKDSQIRLLTEQLSSIQSKLKECESKLETQPTPELIAEDAA